MFKKTRIKWTHLRHSIQVGITIQLGASLLAWGGHTSPLTTPTDPVEFSQTQFPNELYDLIVHSLESSGYSDAATELSKSCKRTRSWYEDSHVKRSKRLIDLTEIRNSKGQTLSSKASEEEIQIFFNSGGLQDSLGNPIKPGFLRNAYGVIIQKSQLTPAFVKELPAHLQSLHVISRRGDEAITSEDYAQALYLLRRFQNLRFLDLSDTQAIEIQAIASLTHLIELNLSKNKIQNIGALSNLLLLKDLDLSSNPLNRIEPLSILKHLRRLDLSFTEVSRLDALSPLTQLASLDLNHAKDSQTDHDLDLLPLSPLTQITSLNLSYTRTSNLEPLTLWENLTEFRLAGTRVRNWTPLAEAKFVKSLRRLDLRSNEIETIDFISTMVHLVRLKLGNNLLSHLPALSHSVLLEDLDLSDNPQLNDIRNLATWVKLKKLKLQRTGLTSANTGIRPISQLKDLTHLDLSDTQIPWLNGIEVLDQLQQIALANTPITDFAPLYLLKNLQGLDISNRDKDIRNSVDRAQSIKTLKVIQPKLRIEGVI